MSRTKKIGEKWCQSKPWSWFQRFYFKSQHSSITKQYIQKIENRKFRRGNKKFLDDVVNDENAPEPKEKRNVKFLMW